MIKPSSDPLAIARVALALAPVHFVAETGARMAANGVATAVRAHDSAALYRWIVSLARLQGISDRAADSFAARRADVAWNDVAAALARAPPCRRLQSHWHFEGCGYRKGLPTCAEPTLLPTCPLPKFDLRKGALNVGAFGLALFIRDVADGDLVCWIDDRLERADSLGSDPGRARRLRDAVALPFAEIAGIGPKLANMILADLLIGGDPGRERWITGGGAMIAVDSLVHAALARTGIIDARGSRHAMGPSCYRPGGCADTLAQLAADLSARNARVGGPAVLPRQLQHAIWYLGAEGGFDICNGRQIDDTVGCRQRWCPASAGCTRLLVTAKIEKMHNVGAASKKGS